MIRLIFSPVISKEMLKMLRSAQLEYYRDEVLTNRKRRKVMNAERKFYEAMTAYIREKKDDWKIVRLKTV